jgi:hypothetical protein
LNSSSRQGEHASIDRNHGSKLQRTMLYLFVLREYYPPLAPDLGEPFLIFCVGGKVIVVHFDLITGNSEGCGDNLFAKRPVDKESKRIRLLQVLVHNESLLQSPSVFVRSRCRVLRSTHQPSIAQQRRTWRCLYPPERDGQTRRKDRSRSLEVRRLIAFA